MSTRDMTHTERTDLAVTIDRAAQRMHRVLVDAVSLGSGSTITTRHALDSMERALHRTAHLLAPAD